MGILIDTSVFIAAEQGKLDFRNFLIREAGTQPVYISSVTASELLHGVERADSVERQRRRQAFVEAVLSDFPVLPFGLSEARIHARIWAQLKTTGRMVGAHDLLIAATALAQKTALGTLNVDEFCRIDGLSVLDASVYGEKAQ